MVRSKFVINRELKFGNGGSGRVVTYAKTFFKQLIARKTISQLQSEAETQNELKRTLGSFQLLALGIGGRVANSKIRKGGQKF